MHQLLIADDNRPLNQALQKFLIKEGFQVKPAYDGQTFCDVLDTSNRNGEIPAIAIIDLNMPQMDGLAAIRFIKKYCPKTAVIAITGSGSMELVKEAIQNGADHYLFKPFDLNELRRTVELILNNNGNGDE